MKVKAVDIARTLGISKSTVSLALNNKPGVNENTRREVIECKERLEKGLEVPVRESRSSHPASRQQVKVLRINNGMKQIIGAEMDLWTDVNAVFEKCLQAHNYSMGVMYLDFRDPDDYIRMYEECNNDSVAGVIIFGTEVVEADLGKIRGIHKPLVIYDCPLPTADYPTVMINNKQGIELAVEELFSKGNEDIVFLNNPMPMFNYRSRTEGFIASMSKRGITDLTDRIVLTDSSIRGVYEMLHEYLKNHRLPQAFITGSYHVSIGLIRALDTAGVKIPEDVSIIGIDEIPDYMTVRKALTCIRVPHTERAYWTIQLLFREIDNPPREKSRLYTDCVLVSGETVLDRRFGGAAPAPLSALRVQAG